MGFLRNIPLAMGGVALATAGLGNLLFSPGGLFNEPVSLYLRYGFGGIALLALILLALRLCFDLEGAKQDLTSPVALTMMPAATMAALLLTIYLAPIAPVVALVLYAIAAVVQVGIIIVFVRRHVLNFALPQVYASWFVATVGIQAVAIASPYMNQPVITVIGHVAFWLGFAAYFVVLVLVAARYLKHREIPEKYRPTIMVFSAPMGICIVGYLSAFPQASPTLLTFMLIVLFFSYLVALAALPGLARLPFYPTHAALGFPMVVSATAFKMSLAFFSKQGTTGFFAEFFLPVLAYFAEILALIVVLYVLLRYLLYFAGLRRESRVAS
ncbi:MAG: TDT family transporter [Coriobacteriia bacterium]|nr:TDT family transporter [Coriobacteriia bacterium]